MTLVEAPPDFIETITHGQAINHSLTMLLQDCRSMVTGEWGHDEKQQ